MSFVPDVARIRLDNALLLFDEFVRATVKQADAATLRGLERRFAERLQIQPSYWSQIKGRSRQIGERLARQFEQLCRKPAGWMDQPHAGRSAPAPGATLGHTPGHGAAGAAAEVRPQDHSQIQPQSQPHSQAHYQPQDDDERFIVSLVLSYYRRHPQRARQRLLDLLGEVLVPAPAAPAEAGVPRPSRPKAAPAAPATPAATGAAAAAPGVDDMALWLRTQSGVAPLKPRR